MACKVCCEDTACCIHSATPGGDGNYPIIGSVGIPVVGQCVAVPRGPCAHGFKVPGSSLVYRGTPKNIGCNRADCSGTPCYCCCQGQCFEIACGEAGAESCTQSGGTVVESCDSCGNYNGDLYGACCSQECDGFHCRRMTACECAQNAQSSGRRFSYFAGPGTECQEASRCCVDGEVDAGITSASACTAAGGTWVTGHACDQYPCGSPPCNCFCDENYPCPSGCTCVNGQCVAGGACCTCPSNEQTWSDFNYPPAILNLGGAFCNPAERDAAAEAIRQATQQQLTGPARAALEAAGWTCVGGNEFVFIDSGPNTEGDFLWNPDCGAGVEVFGATPDNYAVSASCCGTIDTEGEPIDLGFGGYQTYPCVGPYTYTCTENVPAEQCCGIHHPGQPCAEEPCSDGCFERALLGDEAYVDGWCANAASSVGFAGPPCELTTATCGARTLVNEYSPGFGDWIVTVCCDNPLP